MGLAHLHQRIADFYRHVMDHAIRGRMPAQFFGSEGALDEVEHRLGAQRMQTRLQRRRPFPPVVLTLVRGDVP